MDTKRPIVLFQPRTGLYDHLVRNIPVGLLAAARMLVDRYDVVIVDQRLPGWKEKLDEAVRRGPLCVGVTSQTGEQIRYALEVSRQVKRACRAPVIWGGVHPTLLPEQTLQNEAVDAVVAGEGEITFREAADALSAGRDFAGVRGMHYKENGVLRANAPRTEPFDLNAAPPVPYHLVDLRAYAGRALQNFGTHLYYLETGRGCPNRCDYCYHSGMERQTRRTLSAEGIVAAIRHLRRLTPLDGVTFVDDSFLFEKERVFSFVELLGKEGITLVWNCEANVRDVQRLTDAELGVLEASGLRWLALGVESGSERILRESGKHLSLEEVRAVSARLASFGFSVRYNFMNGYIGETVADLAATVRLMRSLLAENPRASIRGFTSVVPYPKTRYYYAALQHGLREPVRLEDWTVFSPMDWGERIPWLNARERRLRRILHVASFFIDRKARINTPPTLAGIGVRVLSFLYRPVARFRFATHSLFLPAELTAFFGIRKLLLRSSGT